MLFYIVLVTVSCVIYIKWRLNYWKRRGVYQFEPEFFFGNARKDLIGEKSKFEIFLERYRFLKAYHLKHAGIYMFLQPLYIPVDPVIIKHIMLKDFSYFKGHGLYHHKKDILTMHLLNLEGDEWKSLRAKLTPTFTAGKMKLMFQILLDKVKVLENVIQTHQANKEPVDIKETGGRFTTDVIASCGFGIECNSLEYRDNDFKTYGTKTFNLGMFKFFVSELLPSWVLSNLGFNLYGHEVTNFYVNTVKNTIRYRESNNLIRKDYLHYLLELKKTENITDEEIIAQCFVFFVAGFETSSTTMSFAMLELAQHQEIQDKLRDEIRDVIKKNGGDITYESVMEMEYLDKVVNETLRKYPPGALITRECSNDYKVPGTDVVIEKGTKLFIPAWGLHNDPEYFPNPEKFNPENFSEENKAKRPDFTFLPFGEGPRMCIGLRFGMLQTKLGLIGLLRKFKYTLNEKTKLPVEMDPESIFVLSVKGDVWVNVTNA